MKSEKLKIVNTHLNFPKVTLKSPLNTGFIIIAAEIDKKNSFFGGSKTKKLLLKDVKLLLKKFKNHTNIIECAIFKAVLFPPGRNGEYFKKINQENIIHTKFDVVLQIETSSPNNINRIKKNNIFRKIENLFKNLSSFHYIFNAKNSRRIGSVNHKKKGIFLFNFFIAENVSTNLNIWEYTAGWFQYHTKLDNSTLFESIDSFKGTYSIINHCRWNSFINILPSLIFKKTFKTFVLQNFEANNVSAIPILYKLA
jgi:hypothetical protein|tara:strand:- start:106 stop:867 length:762 start_codon:yes stop_codon:yes gene_type:complete